MKDLHSHYLPGIDDGAKNEEKTIKMLENAKNNGITDIMFTPHYIVDSRFISNKENNLKIFEPIQKLAKEKYDINVYLGNEVYLSDNMLNLYKNGEISTLNNSRYMLIEIPMYTKTKDAKSLLFELIINGITPILAHPERYVSYYNDIDFFFELRKIGVLMQINYPSLTGLYGSKAKKMAKKLLKANLISFVGSDIHSSTEGKYECIPASLKIIKKIVGEEDLLKITEENFTKVIRNEEI